MFADCCRAPPDSAMESHKPAPQKTFPRCKPKCGRPLIEILSSTFARHMYFGCGLEARTHYARDPASYPLQRIDQSDDYYCLHKAFLNVMDLLTSGTSLV